jgi:hypothetical protein
VLNAELVARQPTSELEHQVKHITFAHECVYVLDALPNQPMVIKCAFVDSSPHIHAVQLI